MKVYHVGSVQFFLQKADPVHPRLHCEMVSLGETVLGVRHAKVEEMLIPAGLPACCGDLACLLAPC